MHFQKHFMNSKIVVTPFLTAITYKKVYLTLGFWKSKGKKISEVLKYCFLTLCIILGHSVYSYKATSYIKYIIYMSCVHEILVNP